MKSMMSRRGQAALTPNRQQGRQDRRAAACHIGLDIAGKTSALRVLHRSVELCRDEPPDSVLREKNAVAGDEHRYHGVERDQLGLQSKSLSDTTFLGPLAGHFAEKAGWSR
jgi:hypothetical protein